MCAKYYENLTMLSKVTAKNVGDVFLDTLYIRCTHALYTKFPFHFLFASLKRLYGSTAN